ncbi:TIGR02530 family flagellar biosynthesis protein [Halobacillus salinus]|uniref:Flagellar protein n=1 Tax=Halobacillus salinus TaxID=192814 RepID=A0A4Z0H351_9BACI|nr:TIGR02530 family flagellar biosynthesis protein [Halobacillus salinus]TGB04802.1 flagellar protein [Halobacillus salinus]
MSKIQPRAHQLLQPFPPSKKTAETKQAQASFKTVFEQANELKVSKHAAQRLNERNIQIDDKQWEKISNKMTEAKQKGITDSLVITDQAALVVSTKNHAVVTAMGRQEANAKIFTNINGTILMD